jgi:hypothetical protein
LIFAAITLLFCVPGANVERLDIAGIVLAGVRFELLVFFMAAAATYYAVLFALTAYVEGKSNLIARERDELDLLGVLNRSLERVSIAIEELTPILASKATRFDQGVWFKKLDELDQLINDGYIFVGRPPVLYYYGSKSEIESELTSLFNAHIANLRYGRHHQSVKEIDQSAYKEAVLEAGRKDFRNLIARGAVEGTQLSWESTRLSIERSVDALNEFCGEFRTSLESHAENLAAYREAISGALFEINILKSVRSIKFWAFEVAVVFLLYAIAIAHYLGRFFVWVPTLLI